MPEREVLLLRYDISNGMGPMYSSILGSQVEAIWHTAIVAYGYEYFFDGGCGIARMAPRTTPFGQPLREESLGMTTKTHDEFEAFNDRMRSSRFSGNSYELTSNNCNNYTHEACMFLTGHGIPDDVINMIPNMMDSPLGQMFTPVAQAVQQSGMLNAWQQMTGLPMPTQLPTRDPRAINKGHGGHGPRKVDGADEGEGESNNGSRGFHAKVEELDSEEEEVAPRRGLKPTAKNTQHADPSRVLRPESSDDECEDVTPLQAGAPPPASAKPAAARPATNVTPEKAAENWANAVRENAAGSVPRLRELTAVFTSALGATRAAMENSGSNGFPLVGISGDPRVTQFLDSVLGVQRNGGRATGSLIPSLATLRAIYEQLSDAAEEVDVEIAIAESSQPAPAAPAVPVNNTPSAPAQQPASLTGPVVARGPATTTDDSFETTFLANSLLMDAGHAPDVDPFFLTYDFGFPSRSRPFTSLDHLLYWNGQTSGTPSVPPLRQRRTRSSGAPLVILLHQHRGGYNEDAFLDCSSSYHSPTPGRSLTVRHWANVDVVVYQSHYFASVPPIGLVRAGHENGTRVHGTLLTTSAQPLPNFWRRVLGSDTIQQRLISQLVLATEQLQFDGWFVDIQGGLDGASPSALEQFFKRLRSALNAAGAELIVDGTFNPSTAQLEPQTTVGAVSSWASKCADVVVLSSSAKQGGSASNVAVRVDCNARDSPAAVRDAVASAADTSDDRGAVCLVNATVSGELPAAMTRTQMQSNENALWNAITEGLVGVAQSCPRCTSLPYVTTFSSGYTQRLVMNGETVNSKLSQFAVEAVDAPHRLAADGVDGYRGDHALVVQPNAEAEIVRFRLTDESVAASSTAYIVISAAANCGPNSTLQLRVRTRDGVTKLLALGPRATGNKPCYQTAESASQWKLSRFTLTFADLSAQGISDLELIEFVNKGSDSCAIGLLSCAVAGIKSSESPLLPGSSTSLVRPFPGGVDPTSCVRASASRVGDSDVVVQFRIPQQVGGSPILGHRIRRVHVFVNNQLVGAAYGTSFSHHLAAGESLNEVSFQAEDNVGIIGSLARARF